MASNRLLWSTGNNSVSSEGLDQQLSLSRTSGDHSITNSSLQIHCDDFFDTVLHIVDADCYPSPSYFSLVDCVPDSAQSSQGPSDNSVKHYHLDRYVDRTVGEQASWDPKSAFLSSKVTFINSSNSLPKKTSRKFPVIWEEFTNSHGLMPYNLMFVGGPQSGQTETAKAVSKMYGKAHIRIFLTVLLMSEQIYPVFLFSIYS